MVILVIEQGRTVRPDMLPRGPDEMHLRDRELHPHEHRGKGETSISIPLFLLSLNSMYIYVCFATEWWWRRGTREGLISILSNSEEKERSSACSESGSLCPPLIPSGMKGVCCCSCIDDPPRRHSIQHDVGGRVYRSDGLLLTALFQRHELLIPTANCVSCCRFAPPFREGGTIHEWPPEHGGVQAGGASLRLRAGGFDRLRRLDGPVAPR